MRVRYSETDAQGIVNNANYLSYFEVDLDILWDTVHEALPPLRMQLVSILPAAKD